MGSSSSSVCDGESATHFEEHCNEYDEADHHTTNINYNDLDQNHNGNTPTSQMQQNHHQSTTSALPDDFNDIDDDANNDVVALSQMRLVKVKIEPQCAGVDKPIALPYSETTTSVPPPPAAPRPSEHSANTPRTPALSLTNKTTTTTTTPKIEPTPIVEEPPPPPPRRQCRAAAQLCQINNLTLLSRDFYESDRQRKRRLAAASARAIKASPSAKPVAAAVVAKKRGRPRNQPLAFNLKVEPPDAFPTRPPPATQPPPIDPPNPPRSKPTACQTTPKAISQQQSQPQISSPLNVPSSFTENHHPLKPSATATSNRGRKKTNKKCDSTYSPSIQPIVNGPPKIRARRNSIPVFQTIRFAATLETEKIITSNRISDQSGQPGRTGPLIKPIFLFAKQEETRIVEVRCEDYDKRNRIRLTKTPGGWRATPRTEHNTTSNMSTSMLLPKAVVTKQEGLDASDEPKLAKPPPVVLRLNPFSKMASQTFQKDRERRKKKKLKKKNKKNKSKHKRRKEKHIVMTYKRVLFAPLIPPPDHEPTPFTTTTTPTTPTPTTRNDDDDSSACRAHTPTAASSVLPQPDIHIATQASPTDFTPANATPSQPSIAVETLLPEHKSERSSLSSAHHQQASSFGELSILTDNEKVCNDDPTNHPPGQPSYTTPLSPTTTTTTSLRFTDSPERRRCAEVAYNATENAMHCAERGAETSEDPDNTADLGNGEKEENDTMGKPKDGYDNNHDSLLDLNHLEQAPPNHHQIHQHHHQHHHHHLQHNHHESSLQCLEYHPVDPSAVPAVVVYEPYDAIKSACNIYDLSVEEGDNIHLHPDNINNHPNHNNNNNIINNNNNNKRQIDCDNNLQQQIVEISDDDHHEHHHHHHHHFSDTAHDLDEYHDLIEGLPQISGNHSTTEDIILDHCDNTMTGTELLDSLVKRGCEDNHISGGEEVKQSICLSSDDYNDDDDILLDSQPVADIISRLGNSLDSSPKCLSFNEAGEIDGLHESLFETSSQTDLNATMNPFSNRSALEELTITLKDLEKRSSEQEQQQREKLMVESTIVTSADSCHEDVPKDLSFKKHNEAAHQSLIMHSISPRPMSHDSDAIQSPQPSGLPAVPPSPDILMHKPIGSNSSHLNKSLFLDLTSPKQHNAPDVNKPQSNQQLFVDLTSPQPQQQKEMSSSSKAMKHMSSESITHLQKEPLDLGKHRKSASPTVSCSEEAKRKHGTPFSESSQSHAKRIKAESSHAIDPRMSGHNSSSKTSQLVELLASGKDPDPLTQLRLLITNPEWKLPDPILVPKDRLNAVLASPAREIPLLLTTRPELRLPEAFAFPSILQDPDILVISFAQLESILQKQQDNVRALSKPLRKECNEKKSTTTISKPSSDKSFESSKTVYDKLLLPSKATTPTSPVGALNSVLPMAGLLGSNVASNIAGGDIDAATMAAFNQMLWLPYLGQMGQLNPEMFKAMTAPVANDPLQFAAVAAAAAAANQNRLGSNFAASNAMNYNNPLEYAMWQEALAQANTAQIQRMMKLNAEREKKSALAESKAQQQQSLQQQQHQQQRQMQQNTNAYLQQQQQIQQQQQNMQQPSPSHSVGHLLSPINPMMSAASFFPPTAAAASASSNRYYNLQHRTQNQHQQSQQQLQQNLLTDTETQFDATHSYRHQLNAGSASEHSSSSRTNPHYLTSASSKSSHSFNHSMSAANPFFSASGLSHMQHDYGGGQSSRSTSSNKARREHQQQQLQQQQYLLHQQQLHQQHQIHQHQQYQHQMQPQFDAKPPRVTCKSLNNLLQPDLVGSPKLTHAHQQLDATAKFSNLMAMPSFDLTSPPVSTTSTNSNASSCAASSFSAVAAASAGVVPKLKVKPGAHLLDPLAMQRRIFGEEVAEVGSTTCSASEEHQPGKQQQQQHAMHPNTAALYHPFLK